MEFGTRTLHSCFYAFLSSFSSLSDRYTIVRSVKRKMSDDSSFGKLHWMLASSSNHSSLFSAILICVSLIFGATLFASLHVLFLLEFSFQFATLLPVQQLVEWIFPLNGDSKPNRFDCVTMRCWFLVLLSTVLICFYLLKWLLPTKLNPYGEASLYICNCMVFFFSYHNSTCKR